MNQLQNTDTFEDSRKKGLTGPTGARVAERRKRFGPNEFPEKKRRTALDIYISQFKDPLIYIISFAAIISIVLHEYNDAVIIAVVILLDSLVGFFQATEPKARALNHCSPYHPRTDVW